jgi:hypothetical protein
MALLFSSALTLATPGCSHTGSPELDRKLLAEPDVSRQELSSEVKNEIESAPHLTLGQKAMLLELRRTVRGEMEKISSESLKLRSLLVKDLLSPEYDRQEVDAIESRLKDLENNRISSLFRGVREANEILGRQADDLREPVIRDLFDGFASHGSPK